MYWEDEGALWGVTLALHERTLSWLVAFADESRLLVVVVLAAGSPIGVPPLATLLFTLNQVQQKSSRRLPPGPFSTPVDRTSFCFQQISKPSAGGAADYQRTALVS